MPLPRHKTQNTRRKTQKGNSTAGPASCTALPRWPDGAGFLFSCAGLGQRRVQFALLRDAAAVLQRRRPSRSTPHPPTFRDSRTRTAAVGLGSDTRRRQGHMEACAVNSIRLHLSLVRNRPFSVARLGKENEEVQRNTEKLQGPNGLGHESQNASGSIACLFEYTISADRLPEVLVQLL